MDFWSCAFELIPCLRGCKLEPSFKDILYCSCYLFSAWTFKHIYHWRSIRITLQHQPTKYYASSVESRDTSSSTYHPTKEKNTNYQFHLGILYADDLPYPHYENPPQVFQSVQQTPMMEGHQPFHDIFHQIILQRLRKKYESGSSYTPYSTYYITVFLPILPLEYEGILPVTAPLTWGFCLGLQCIFQRLKWSQCNKGQRRIITWLWQSNGLGIDPTSKWWWVLLSHAGTERTAI